MDLLDIQSGSTGAFLHTLITCNNYTHPASYAAQTKNICWSHDSSFTKHHSELKLNS